MTLMTPADYADAVDAAVLAPTVGERLRRAHDHTLERTARAIDTSTVNVWRWEHGENLPLSPKGACYGRLLLAWLFEDERRKAGRA